MNLFLVAWILNKIPSAWLYHVQNGGFESSLNRPRAPVFQIHAMYRREWTEFPRIQTSVLGTLRLNLRKFSSRQEVQHSE